MAELSIETMAAALRATADRLGTLPWSTGIEDAFRMLAEEIPKVALNLDPKAYVHQGSGGRLPSRMESFYGVDAVQFQPREGYNQNEEDYLRE